MPNKRPIVEYAGQPSQVADGDPLVANAGLVRDGVGAADVSLYGNDPLTNTIIFGRAGQFVEHPGGIRLNGPGVGEFLVIDWSPGYPQFTLIKPLGGGFVLFNAVQPSTAGAPGLGFSVAGSPGGNGDAVSSGGLGGSISIIAGYGGAGSLAQPPGAGGPIQIGCGIGGNGTATQPGGPGGGLILNAGNGGSDGGVGGGLGGGTVVTSGTGGTGSGGGYALLLAGAGGVAGSGFPGGLGGNAAVASGQGGVADAANPAGTGGFTSIAGGPGGDGTLAQPAGAGGPVLVSGGAAGVNNLGGGNNGGDVTITGGSATGAGTNGEVIIATTSTSALRLPDQAQASTVIGATAQGATYTGANLKRLHDGSDADTPTVLHTHSTLGSGVMTVTPEGGIAIIMVNNTGVPIAKGTIVCSRQSLAALGYANEIEPTPVPLVNQSDMPIGVVYDAGGIPSGGSGLVVIAGRADVNVENVAFVGSGWVVYTTSVGVSGQGTAAPSVPATVVHFRELGHTLAERAAGSGALIRCILHFN